MLTAVLLMLAQPEAPIQVRQLAPMPTGEALEAAIARRDAELFHAAFEGCDPAALAEMIDRRFVMIHDLAGLAVPSGMAFVRQMQAECASREPGGEKAGYKNRREVVPGSRIVRAMGTWGALEEGHHVFFEWVVPEAAADAPDAGYWNMTGGAKYMHLWRWEPANEGSGGEFILERSYSYDHGPVGGDGEAQSE